jgi:hypothetical protein
MQPLEVSGAVRHIYICVCVVRWLKVNNTWYKLPPTMRPTTSSSWTPLSTQQSFTVRNYLLLRDLKVYRRVHKSQPLNSPPWAIPRYNLNPWAQFSRYCTCCAMVCRYKFLSHLHSVPHMLRQTFKSTVDTSQARAFLLFRTVPRFTVLSMKGREKPQGKVTSAGLYVSSLKLTDVQYSISYVKVCVNMLGWIWFWSMSLQPNSI